ncbi:hypothetical protein HPB51_014883 [Rhipicephalus microplus]|uniref:Uncharacterized protein n=1 Tax=Rhipicephalus microplus TaxID=6941 RepID=A0A9J6EHA7_RHIMP|nr:hypothetical protein HPB51_014883 [Rhipicephalus microplus]
MPGEKTLDFYEHVSPLRVRHPVATCVSILLNGCAVRGRIAYVPGGGEEYGDRVRGVLRDSVSSAWAVREGRNSKAGLSFAGRPVPGRTRSATSCCLDLERSRQFRYDEIGPGNVHEAGPRPSRCVQTGTLRVRPTSTHRPRASTVERVLWAQRPGINCRGVDLRDFTRPDQEPSYGIGQTVYARRLRLGDLIGSDKKLYATA